AHPAPAIALELVAVVAGGNVDELIGGASLIPSGAVTTGGHDFAGSAPRDVGRADVVEAKVEAQWPGAGTRIRHVGYHLRDRATIVSGAAAGVPALGVEGL